MNGLQPGLVSVTFRQLVPAEIVALVARAGLSLIEWGGDIHVPPGDLAHAREVGAMTREAGLGVAAYGSYYRLGDLPPSVAFEPVLETALVLGAPLIRVWAGTHGSGDAAATDRERVIADTRRICDLAAAANIAVAYEFHGGTLTDTVPSARSLLLNGNRPNLRTLWQPLKTSDPGLRAAEVTELLPWLANLHVYHRPDETSAPLAAGAADWEPVLAALAVVQRPFGLLLEFVRDATPGQFLADASTLRSWLSPEGKDE